MTRMFSRIGGALLVTTLWLSGCAAPVEDDGKAMPSAMSKSIVRVGLTANYPPLVSKIDGELAGI